MFQRLTCLSLCVFTSFFSSWAATGRSQEDGSSSALHQTRGGGGDGGGVAQCSSRYRLLHEWCFLERKEKLVRDLRPSGRSFNSWWWFDDVRGCVMMSQRDVFIVTKVSFIASLSCTSCDLWPLFICSPDWHWTDSCRMKMNQCFNKGFNKVTLCSRQ